MTEPAANPAGEAVTAPSFPTLRRIDATWCRVERALCGGMFLFMALIVFATVLRDMFVTGFSVLDIAVLFVISLGAAFTRARKEGETARWTRWHKVGFAAVATGVIAGLIQLYVTILPGGLQWTSKAALCLMLWVGFLGASVATHDKAHLALEVGEKIWPKGMRHMMKAFAHSLTAAFCVVLFILSVESLAAHHHDWAAADGFADTIPTMPWLPQWVVFIVFPYTFIAMAVRFLAQMVTTASRTDIQPEGGPT